jgi:hypothetical protein
MNTTEQVPQQLKQSKFNIKNIFLPDYENYEGVRRINIYVMRLFFALMFVFVATDSWTVILTHEGAWDPTRAVAWCCWAAYSTMALLGVFHTLRMLPIMLFMIFYKGLWLAVVAYPLWSAGTLEGSPAEGMAYMFSGIIIPILFVPWKYVFKKYILFETKKKSV